MPRAAKFTADQILDAARDAIMDHGRGVTIAQIATRSGAPVGSIYHRFNSREELLIELWLRSIRRFHVVLHQVLDTGQADPHGALVRLGSEVVRYCRLHPAEAMAMTLFRHERLLETVPDRLRDDVEQLNVAVFTRLAATAIAAFPAKRHDAMFQEITTTAVFQLPYGLVRPLVGGPIPEWLDGLVAAGVEGALAVVTGLPEA